MVNKMQIVGDQVVDSDKQHLTQYVLIEPEELRALVKDTVKETFESMGVQTKDLKETQKDFIFLTSLRKKFDNASMWVGRGVLLSILAFIITLLSLGTGVWTNIP
jgi:hypothetical protein